MRVGIAISQTLVKRRMTRTLLGVATSIWLANEAFNRFGSFELSVLWCHLPMLAIPVWSVTRIRLFSLIGGFAALLQSALSIIFILSAFISFMNPVVSVGVKIFGTEAFRLEGLGQISFYFILRSGLFLAVSVLLFRSKASGAGQAAP